MCCRVFGTDVPQVDVSAISDVCIATTCSFLEGVPDLKIVAMITLNDDVLLSHPPVIKVITVVESVQVRQHLSLKLRLR